MKSNIIAVVAAALVGVGALTSAQAGHQPGKVETTKGCRISTINNDRDYRMSWNDRDSRYNSDWDNDSDRRITRRSESAKLQKASKDEGEPKLRNNATRE